MSTKRGAVHIRYDPVPNTFFAVNTTEETGEPRNLVHLYQEQFLITVDPFTREIIFAMFSSIARMEREKSVIDNTKIRPRKGKRSPIGKTINPHG